MSQWGIFEKSDDSKSLLAKMEGPVTLGKSESADVKVNDLRTSGFHALILNEDQKFKIIDLGSRFGTYVDQKRIEEGVLQPKQEFQIGRKVLFIDEVNQKEKIKVIEDNLESEAYVETALDFPLLEVSLHWGSQLIDVRTFEKNSKITLGPQKGATFSAGVDYDQEKPFKIAQFDGDILELELPVQTTGLVWIGTETFSLDTLRHRDREKTDFSSLDLKLRIGDRAFVDIGELSLYFRFVKPAKDIPFQWPKIPKALQKIVGSVLGFYLLFFSILGLWQVDPEEKKIEDVPKHLKKVLFHAGQKEAQKRQQAAVGQVLSQLGGRARGKEGKSKAKKAKASQKKAPQKKTAKQKAKNAKKVDLSQAFTPVQSHFSKQAVQSGNPSSGNTASALTEGGFASGTKGLGAGGGGQSVGVGALQGQSTGGGMGAGDHGLSPSKGQEIKVPALQEVVVLGGLDPDVIAAIIRRYLPQIQYCYEQQLSQKPNLKGKVSVAFTINGKGGVNAPKIASSSLKDSATHRCILKKVKNWKFPKPRGGGTVGVKYPFLLMSTTDE